MQRLSVNIITDEQYWDLNTIKVTLTQYFYCVSACFAKWGDINTIVYTDIEEVISIFQKILKFVFRDLFVS